MLHCSTFALTEARVHRFYGADDEAQAFGHSPWLVAVDFIPTVDDALRGYPGIVTTRAADDGFGNLLAVGRRFQ